MKFRSFSFALGLVLCSGIACDDGAPATDRRIASNPPSTAKPVERGETSSPSARRSLDDLRARADAAFETLESGGAESRSQSRIGPQPWPSDLPTGWPQPDDAVVLADTRRGADARLLLIDLPETPEDALDRYRRALNQNGFDTQEPQGRSTLSVLHARRDEWEAVLTFIGRERATRVEILFLDRAAG